jgi:hypothetical protein
VVILLLRLDTPAPKIIHRSAPPLTAEEMQDLVAERGRVITGATAWIDLNRSEFWSDKL